MYDINRVTIAIATHGDPAWLRIANKRAIPSAKEEGVPFVLAHGLSLSEARNAALSLVKTEWVIHLDADDELEPGYVDAMFSTDEGDVRVCSVRRLLEKDASSLDTLELPSPKMLQACPWSGKHTHACSGECILVDNWVTVGSMVKTDLVRQIGGWNNWPEYEDWELWIRCYLAGSKFVQCPDAVYRAWRHDGSRSLSTTPAERTKTFRAIQRACGIPVTV